MSEANQVIKGTPVGRGKYKGIARVVTRVADAHQIENVAREILTFLLRSSNQFLLIGRHFDHSEY